MASHREDINWQANMFNIEDSAKLLFNTQIMSDVTFLFKEKKKDTLRIYAHTWILSLLSPKFYQTFKGNFEYPKEINISNCSYEGFFESLKYIYTCHCNLTKNNMFEILSVANKYQLVHLEEISVKFISQNFSVETVGIWLQKAINKGQHLLKLQIINFIGSRMEAVIQSDSFLKLEKKTVGFILNIDGELSEMSLLSCIMKWAENKCKSRNLEVNGENKRKCLGNLIKTLRFPLMSEKTDEIAQCLTLEQQVLDDFNLFVGVATRKRNNKGSPVKSTKFNINAYDLNNHIFFLRHKDENVNLNNYPGNNNISKFSVNKKIYIIGIGIGSPEIPQIGQVYLYDDHSTLLYNGKNKIGEKFVIHTSLFTPIILYPNREYIIDIKYEHSDCRFVCINRKSIAWQKNYNEVDFQFFVISPLLRWLAIKNLEFPDATIT